jgi:crotonobetainyl-CoA:carnitine CoA-transferase CaiB-like acyl-CoA transferase
MRGVVNVPCGPINNLQQMFDDPQVQHRGIRVTSPHPLAGRMPMVASPMRFSATPITYDVSPPLLGEHTRQVLGELAGIDDAAFTKLSERGIV